MSKITILIFKIQFYPHLSFLIRFNLLKWWICYNFSCRGNTPGILSLGFQYFPVDISRDNFHLTFSRDAFGPGPGSLCSLHPSAVPCSHWFVLCSSFCLEEDHKAFKKKNVFQLVTSCICAGQEGGKHLGFIVCITWFYNFENPFFSVVNWEDSFSCIVLCELILQFFPFLLKNHLILLREKFYYFLALWCQRWTFRWFVRS